MTEALWTVHVLTLFPEMFPGPLAHSLPGKAREAGLWKLNVNNIRNYASNKHQKVDDSPYGGGSGMVMMPEVADAALKAVPDQARRIHLSPRGKKLDQALLQSLAATKEVALFCGRYEGLDERVIEAHKLEEISLGDFVLAGGEIAAFALIEGVVRLLPGVLGNEAATEEESFAQGLLEYPHYTRPAEWTTNDGRTFAVPDVLRSGDHGKVAKWRKQQSLELTQERRPDLLKDKP